jgi:hypothetical protein
VRKRAPAYPFTYRLRRRIGLFAAVNTSLVMLWMATAGARETVLGIGQGPDFCWPLFSILPWGGAIAVSVWRERRQARLTEGETPLIALT